MTEVNRESLNYTQLKFCEFKDREREKKQERERVGQNMHAGVLIRVMDTPINGMTHPGSLSPFMPFHL